MSNNKFIQFIQVNPDDYHNAIVNSVKEVIENFKETFNSDDSDKLLTREETCNFLKIDSSTLWHWTNKGKVIAYGIGNRRYYKKAELLNSLQQLKK